MVVVDEEDMHTGEVAFTRLHQVPTQANDRLVALTLRACETAYDVLRLDQQPLNRVPHVFVLQVELPGQTGAAVGEGRMFLQRRGDPFRVCRHVG
jgi:hypothetical protein